MNSKRKNILVYLLFISFYLSADTISKSRENAITRAIEKVGPTVASINVIQDIAALCRDLEIDMAEVALKNLSKLKSRQERGTIQGSGDNR